MLTFLFIDTKDDALSTIDMIICMGGDGTLLYTSSMFQVIIIIIGKGQTYDYSIIIIEFIPLI